MERIIEMDDGVRLADLAEELTRSGVVVKQRLGARLLVVDAPQDLERAPGGLQVLTGDEVVQRATGTDRSGARLALAAQLRRTSPERQVRKRARPHVGADWDSPTGGARPDPAGDDLAAAAPTLTATAAAATAARVGSLRRIAREWPDACA